MAYSKLSCHVHSCVLALFDLLGGRETIGRAGMYKYMPFLFSWYRIATQRTLLKAAPSTPHHPVLKVFLYYSPPPCSPVASALLSSIGGCRRR